MLCFITNKEGSENMKLNMKQIILAPDLVPSTSWFKNLRNKDPKAWEIIRKASYAKAENQCEICGAKGKLHCHENWSYNEQSGIQKLESLISLCADCHEVKHIGLAEVKGRLEQALTHMIKINGIKLEEAIGIVREAFKIWAKRSKMNWKLDVSGFEK